jgi:hypothetical protein
MPIHAGSIRFGGSTSFSIPNKLYVGQHIRDMKKTLNPVLVPSIMNASGEYQAPDVFCKAKGDRLIYTVEGTARQQLAAVFFVFGFLKKMGFTPRATRVQTDEPLVKEAIEAQGFNVNP